MKKLFSVLFAAVMAGAMVLMTACGGETGDLQKQLDELTQRNEELLQENQQLQGGVSELQEALAELIAENDLTQEELLDVEYAFKKLIGIDWLNGDAAYATDRLYVRIGPDEAALTAEDFLPVEAAEIEETYRCDAFTEYLLTLKTSGVEEWAYAMTKLYTFDFVEEVQPYKMPREWQLAADRGGYFVGVRETLLDGPLTAEDLAPVSVAEVIPVEGVSAWTTYRDPVSGESRITTIGFYVITAEGPREELPEALSGMDIVDYAWENTYDYETRHYPMEEKEALEEIPDSWLSFFGSYTVQIDRAYAGRIFTADDFAGFAAGPSVTWVSYHAFKSGEEAASPLYTLGVLDHDAPKDVVEQYGRLLSRFDHVQSCLPRYGVDDGYKETKTK